jgi:enterochelin esterase family protein
LKSKDMKTMVQRRAPLSYLGALGVLAVHSLLATAQDMPLSQVLIDGEGWKLVAKDFKTPWALAADRNGNVYVGDPENNRIDRVDPDGKVATFARLNDVRSLAFGGKERLFAAQPADVSIRALDTGAKIAWETQLKSGVWHLAVAPNGTVYASVPAERAVYALAPDGKHRKVAENIGRPAGLAFWPDAGTLAVADAAGKHVLAYRVEKDGSLTYREGYATLRLAPGQKASGATGVTADAAGRLYVATPLGVQVFDPTGRMSGVVLNPADGLLPAIAFGGPAGDTLYALCGDKLFARKTKAKGLVLPGKP